MIMGSPGVDEAPPGAVVSFGQAETLEVSVVVGHVQRFRIV
jgi:hypothetical protein